MNDPGYLHRKSDNFGKVPIELVHNTKITDGAVRLYGHMHWRYGDNHQNFEGMTSMAKHMGVSEKTISNRIKELEANDWLIVVERQAPDGQYKTPYYHVFELQEDCRAFRASPVLKDGQSLRDKPDLTKRKSRKGVGGRKNFSNGAQIPMDDHRNSSSDGSSEDHRNSSSDYLDSVYYPDSEPNGIDEKSSDNALSENFFSIKSAIKELGESSFEGPARYWRQTQNLILISALIPQIEAYETRRRQRNKDIASVIKVHMDTGVTDRRPGESYQNDTNREDAAAILDLGYTAEDVARYVKDLKQGYWRGKVVPLSVIRKGIKAWMEDGDPENDEPPNPAHVRYIAPDDEEEGDPEIRAQVMRDIHAIANKIDWEAVGL